MDLQGPNSDRARGLSRTRVPTAGRRRRDRITARMRSLAAVLALCTALPAQDAPSDPLEAALTRAGDNAPELRKALSDAPAAQREALAFLVTHMPERDLQTSKAEFLLADVALAHEARAAAPWGTAIPDDVFLDAILPYAQLDETREAWRASLRATCLPMVEGCVRPGDAACRLNEKLFLAVNVRYSTKRQRANQSPSESMAQGLASCSGLSILLADACRAVGVPARIAGIASWPGRGGNHTWVEVWDDGWHFLGAAEPDPAGLDRGWFAGEAAGAIEGDQRRGLFAVSWRATGQRFPLAWAPRTKWPNGVEVTARYAKQAADGDEALRAQFARFFAASPEAQAKFEFDRNLDAKLVDAKEDARLRALAWEAFSAAPHPDLRADHAGKRVRAGGYESAFTVKAVGEKPAGGYGLVIAMHGGGGAPKQVNDQQWGVMQRYYKDQPEAGAYLYCALRAPTDEWNGFYTGYAYPLVERLIRQFAICDGIDTDKVFLIGYSHGGYGAFAIAPMLADRFAAAHSSAAAPTDGVTSARNLRNLRFTFMVGEKDNAYGRRARCETFAKQLAELRGDRTDVFPGGFLYQEGYGHGGLPDRDILKDLLPFVRQPAPSELTWEPVDPAIRAHHWLTIDSGGGGKRVDARLEGQRLTLTRTGNPNVTLHLDARLCDLTRPLALVVDGAEREVPLRPSLRTLLTTMQVRGDVALAASVEVVTGGG